MNATISRISTAVFFATACAASANAEYRCASAPSPLDQRACAAAEQGPAALRRFVYRWDSQMSNLYFADYVDTNTERAWEAKSKQAQRQDVEDRVKLASSERR